MAVTPIKRYSEPGSSLDEAHSLLSDCAFGLAQYHHLLSRQDAQRFVLEVEQVSKVIDHLQILAARVADHHGLASEPAGGPTVSGPAEPVPTEDPTSASSVSSASSADEGQGARNCADFLRETLGISRFEAKRRLKLASVVLPSLSPTGNPIPPRLAALGEAVGSFMVSGRAATVVAQAVERAQSVATPEQLETMEHHLTTQAMESDEDILRVLARRWEAVLDQDGQEPTEKVLRARQGVFLKGRRNGLHFLEIGATDEQFEQLATVMNPSANPRGSSGRAGRAADDTAPGVAGYAAAGVILPEAPAMPRGSGSDPTGRAESDPTGRARSSAAIRTPWDPDDRPESSTTGASEPGTARRAGPATAAERVSDVTTDAAPETAGEQPRVGTPGCAPGRSASGASYGTSVDPGGPTRAQQLLEGLVAACSAALSTGGVPATGGHRPQVMVTIGFEDLVGETERPGDAVFSEQINARSIRRIACDADIIPLVLGGAGQVLDVGRAQRLFPPHLRRALVARDKGCAFPDCSVPASWCEAHHLMPWSRGGSTSIDNGVLLCSRHHHVIHHESWSVELRSGIPWFTAPAGRRRTGNPRRNLYWQAGLAVQSELDVPERVPGHSRTVSSGSDHEPEDSS